MIKWNCVTPLAATPTRSYLFIFHYVTSISSTAESINLLAIFYHSQIAYYDINTFLKPIVEEIRKLESGHLFCINGRFEIFYGTLTAVIADNLANHQVGGLKLGSLRGLRNVEVV